jgi:hypothetical protein
VTLALVVVASGNPPAYVDVNAEYVPVEAVGNRPMPGPELVPNTVVVVTSVALKEDSAARTLAGIEATVKP